MTDISDTTELTFVARRSLIERCLRWRLTRTSLLCERDKMPVTLLSRLLMPSAAPWPESVPFDEITSIRLRFDPTRFAPNRYRCDLRCRSGARCSILSTHYVSPGHFEDLGDRYTEFVGNLVFRIQRSNPSVKLAGGLSWPSYLLQHGLLLASLIALATMLGIAGLPGFGSVWAKLALIVTYAGVALRYAVVNKPRHLSPLSRKEVDGCPASRRLEC